MRNFGLLFCLAAVSWAFAFGQSGESLLYSFGGYANDGQEPSGGLQFDSSGNIYGVTTVGGEYCSGGCGTVYELTPSSGGWAETILYDFCITGDQYTCADGALPEGGLIIDGAGNLYGTTSFGGTNGFGTVFRLTPPSGGNGAWVETVLWNFAPKDKHNGAIPAYGKLNIDAANNLYGTTSEGGAKNQGTVFELVPVGDGTYNFSLLHSFAGTDGSGPQYGVAIDESGNLYGTTQTGGPANAGVVYELSQSEGSWKGKVLYHFNGTTGGSPISALTFDKAGNLYGTFADGGEGQCGYGDALCGGVFKLSPGIGGAQGKAYFYLFAGSSSGGNPFAGVIIDEQTGSLIGTTSDGGPGNIFSLKGRTETVLYNFCSAPGCTDGRVPSFGDIVLRSGQIYGAVLSGGQYNAGGVYNLPE